MEHLKLKKKNKQNPNSFSDFPRHRRSIMKMENAVPVGMKMGVVRVCKSVHSAKTTIRTDVTRKFAQQWLAELGK